MPNMQEAKLQVPEGTPLPDTRANSPWMVLKGVGCRAVAEQVLLDHT